MVATVRFLLTVGSGIVYEPTVNSNDELTVATCLIDAMENVWITTAEVQVEPGDMPSGDTLGFMRITMWASSEEDFVKKLESCLAKYRWNLLSMGNTEVVDPSKDYGDEVNQMIDETLQDDNAVRLSTYYSYKPS